MIPIVSHGWIRGPIALNNGKVHPFVEILADIGDESVEDLNLFENLDVY